jgi:hypothetical protein
MWVKSHLELSSNISSGRGRDHRKIPALPLNAGRNPHEGTTPEIRACAHVGQVSAIRNEVVANLIGDRNATAAHLLR